MEQQTIDLLRPQYKTILADPPWQESGSGKIKRGADRHYPLMPIKEIIALGLRVQRVTHLQGCHLYLWVTNNFLEKSFEVMKAWGFRYITCITWTKDKIGLGQYFRGKTEQLLFGSCGNLPYKAIDGKRAQGTTCINAPRLKHSQKPPEAREMIELVSYQPRLEMFARETTPDWDCWGNEVEGEQGSIML